MPAASGTRIHRRISTALLTILTALAGVLLLGLVVVTFRLVQIQADLGELGDSALPRLVKLSQLSQEAAATISIAPALSAKPGRFEFETLLSRITDKESSQEALIEEVAALVHDDAAANTLRRNGRLLRENLQNLTGVVSEQIAVRRSLEAQVELLRGAARDLADAPLSTASEEASVGLRQLAGSAVFRALSTLLDPNGARFSRNRTELEAEIATLGEALAAIDVGASDAADGPFATTRALLRHWETAKARIFEAKQAELANDFRIKALVEENSLLANRLLGSLSTEFWRVNGELRSHIAAVGTTAGFTLAVIVAVVVTLGAGDFLVWSVLKKRVFERLARIRSALQTFAETRQHPPADPVADEIGAISTSLSHYMRVIDERESELAGKNRAMEQMANQLAKYLSPQVYDSIFSGRQEAKVVSSRKKLTVFFSDIADFTETADRLESEELTQILNQYLTEMSRIALRYGATIDKYIGDAILVFLGDPESRGIKEDAIAGVEMAIAMRKRLHDLRDGWRDSGMEKALQVRMGIHTGYCTVGNFGSEDRMDYTIIGGAVNTAARLQALAEPGGILTSFETYALIKERIRCERHGEVGVRGIAYPVAAYRVIDSYANLGLEQRHFRETRSNLKLDLNLEAMSQADRSEAEDILRHGLDLLARPWKASGDVAQPETSDRARSGGPTGC